MCGEWSGQTHKGRRHLQWPTRLHCQRSAKVHNVTERYGDTTLAAMTAKHRDRMLTIFGGTAVNIQFVIGTMASRRDISDMATHSGVQLALSRLFGIPSSRLQGIARELNYADLRQNLGRGRRPAHISGAEIFAYALPIVTRMPIRDIGRSLADILKMPAERPTYALHGGVGQGERLPDIANIGIGHTFGDVVGQLIDGELQSAVGFADESAIAIEVDTPGLHATVRIHGQDADLMISFSRPSLEPRHDTPLSWQTTYMTERLINRLALISKQP